jgi:5-methylcytosine-specific restriction protein A
MKLTTLKPRLAGLPNRLNQAPAGQERMRGRAAVNRRANWLRLHPLCEECDKEGKTTVGVVVDHITPLWEGGSDDYEANGQTLCQPHHDAKTAEEAARRSKAGR